MSEEQEDIVNGGGGTEPSPRPHDELWGRLVIAALLFGLLSMLAFFAFLGYRIYDGRHEDGPSIADLPKSAEPADSVREAVAAVENVPAQETPAPADAKQSAISVLNAGGGSGVAGTLADLLKGAGYAKTTAGNADGNYSGVTVFYAQGQEAAAKTVLAEVMKKYPKATVSAADQKNKETSVAAIVVIIGK